MNTKITDIVQRTNIGIVCVSISYKRKKQFKTWDFFQLPYPFNTIIIEYDKITTLKEDENVKEVNKYLENQLNEMMLKNDTLLS